MATSPTHPGRGRPVPAPPARARRGLGAQDGVLSLEAALLLPFAFVLLLAVFSTVVVGRDLLLAQEAARAAARVAATTQDHGAVEAAAVDAAGGREIAVSVVPRARQPGDTVRVKVTLHDRLGPVPVRMSGRATARVEPVVGR